MDAPKGRYRVEEKDGRLVTIDTHTGAPIPLPGVSTPASPKRPSGPVAPAPPGLVDRAARALLPLAVNHWDEQGRAIVAWQWEQNGRTRRWDAALDSAQQRRLGRGLLAFAAFPVAILLSIFTGGGALLLIPVAVPATLWGVWAVVRLQRQTGGTDG